MEEAKEGGRRRRKGRRGSLRLSSTFSLEEIVLLFFSYRRERYSYRASSRVRALMLPPLSSCYLVSSSSQRERREGELEPNDVDLVPSSLPPFLPFSSTSLPSPFLHLQTRSHPLAGTLIIYTVFETLH